MDAVLANSSAKREIAVNRENNREERLRILDPGVFFARSSLIFLGLPHLRRAPATFSEQGHNRERTGSGTGARSGYARARTESRSPRIRPHEEPTVTTIIARSFLSATETHEVLPTLHKAGRRCETATWQLAVFAIWAAAATIPVGATGHQLRRDTRSQTERLRGA